MSWGSSLTGYNEDLCIHPRELELSVKARMWNPCPIFWMAMQIDVSEGRNYSRFNIRTPCNSGGMRQRHEMPLLLYLPIAHIKELDQSVTFGIVNNMLFIGATLSVTQWRIFIQSWRYCLFQDRRRCVHYLFPLFRRWYSKFRK